MKRLNLLGYWLVCAFCFTACNTASTPSKSFHYNYDTENGTGVREPEIPIPAITTPHVPSHLGEHCMTSSDCEGNLLCVDSACSVPPYSKHAGEACAKDIECDIPSGASAKYGCRKGKCVVPPPPPPVSLWTIVNEYRNNEVRADNKYKGETIHFTGTISRISKNLLWLNNENVAAVFDNTDLSNLNPGETIELTCLCSGSGIVATVHFEHCQ